MRRAGATRAQARGVNDSRIGSDGWLGRLLFISEGNRFLSEIPRHLPPVAFACYHNTFCDIRSLEFRFHVKNEVSSSRCIRDLVGAGKLDLAPAKILPEPYLETRKRCLPCELCDRGFEDLGEIIPTSVPVTVHIAQKTLHALHRGGLLSLGIRYGLNGLRLTHLDLTAGCYGCLLYTSDAADEEDSVDLGGRRIIKKK